MRIITKKKINKAVDEIIDAIFDHADFDIDVNGYQDYDVLMFVNKDDKPAVANLLYEILIDKKPRKWWKLSNVTVRGVK